MRDWKGLRVVVLGLARQGKAAARFFSEHGAQVVASDLKPLDDLRPACEELAGLPIEFVLGGHPPGLLAGADLLCLSGGVPADLPLAQQARAAGVGLTNDAQVFLDACPARTIGITGSAGKTTTTALVGRMAEHHLAGSGARAWVGGNIGRPLLAVLPEIQPNDWVVQELSSFQLELMTASVHVAAVLNVTPNHLDRHHTMQAYTEAKARLLGHQEASGTAVLCREDLGSWALRDRVRGELIAFGRDDHELDGTFVADGGVCLRRHGRLLRLLPLSDIRLRGEHNLLNVLAACAVAAAAELSAEAMAAAVRAFEGVPHRLEFVRRLGGADWYNDSIGTAPERAMAAIRAFDEPIVLLAGGRDKDLPWDSFADVVSQRVDHLVLFGEAADKVGRAVQAAMARQATPRPESIDRCQTLAQAVQAAARRAEAGDVVLLSPGGTSFDEFPDFEARGGAFRSLVQAL
ncbi:MAG: UDP-N-acetylmuramoyl-L-alanine--D-glutamate ligase [Anaerolineales bacterium]|nr:UDP-N-acetylmuramoyl-L-alanine--D-glutamate ligase [Anaerolineales bacterium]